MGSDVVASAEPRSLGQRLQQARRARGLTQEKAAEHIGVARTTLTAIEKGERRIQQAELIKLARLYGRDIGEMLRASPPVKSFAVQLRAQLAPNINPDPQIAPSIADLELLVDDYVELERITKAPLPRNYPRPYRHDSEISPEVFGEDMANQERMRLGLGDGPLANLRDTLENDVGLRIFYMPLSSQIAAMFACTDETGGCIAVNSKHPVERRRMSLAHDYAHFLVGRYEAEVTLLGNHVRYPRHERIADAFARALLMPASSLRRRAGEIRLSRGGSMTPADICMLADQYLVAVEAMTRRLEDVQVLSIGTWERLRQRGFQPGEAKALLGLPPREVPDELLPRRYRQLALEAFERGDLTEGQFARFLRIDRLAAREIVEALAASGGTDRPHEDLLSVDIGSGLQSAESSRG